MGTTEIGDRLPRLAAVVTTIVAAIVLALSGLAWNERFEARQQIALGPGGSPVAHAQRATRLAPWDPDGWLLLAQTALAGEPRNRDVAAGAVERAIALAPTRPAARALRARLRREDGDVPGALADIAEASRLYPVNPLYARTKSDLEGRFRAPESAP